MDITAEFMSAVINAFEANKRLADRAVEQMPDDKLHTALDANTNSVAHVSRGLAGVGGFKCAAVEDGHGFSQFG